MHRSANDAQPDNATKMKAAVARWIAEASTMTGGVFLLKAKIDWLKAQSRLLSGKGKTPSHLLGLTAFDIAEGIETLMSAVDAQAVAADFRAAA